MNDWAYQTLGELVQQDRRITYGIVQPGPDVYPDGIPLIRGKDYSSGKVSSEGLYHVKPEVDAPYRRSKVQGGDLLLSIAGYVGQIAIVPDVLDGANLTQTTARLSIDSCKGDSQFVYHAINSQEFSKEIDRYTKGSAQSGLNLGDVEKFRVLMPDSLCEQREIAKILSTVDNLIEKTQTLIDKYQSIKQGMMHDLFTRGVDESGQLRPRYEDAPHLYKESELGGIPKEWECGRVGRYLKSINQGWSPNCDSAPAVQGKWGVLKTTAVTWQGFNDVENKELPSNLKPKPEHEVAIGDVLVTRAGPNTRVGVVAYVYQTRPMLMLSDKLYRLVPNSDLNGEFLSLALSSSGSQGDLSAKKTGLAESQTNISQGIVRDILIPVPSSGEQSLIADVVRRKSMLIEAEKVSLEKLNKVKSGLMQDLLTGKVRVKVDA